MGEDKLAADNLKGACPKLLEVKFKIEKREEKKKENRGRELSQLENTFHHEW